MATINVDFNEVIGEIKPMNAVNQPPIGGGFLKFDFSHIEHLTKASIPYTRLHDIMGPFGSNRFVDIPNIFRDFDADENDPKSYDFAFTDELVKAVCAHQVKPVYGLSVTIENQAHIKAYRIHPPKDYAKWARVCEHIIRHYNEGWADGFEFGIEYWEIWNEPENGVQGLNQMWTGTAQQYYELYDVTAKHLKACFGDSIKVGGYGATGFSGIFYDPERYGVDVPKAEPDGRMEDRLYRMDFLYGFLNYIKEHQSPIDFFSWHSYYGVEKTKTMALFLDRVLTEYGYGGIETHLNEWNNAHKREMHGSSYASAATAAMFCEMQDSPTSMLFYYDARLQASAYGGMFNPIIQKPVSVYYAFDAFGYLYRLKHQVKCECEGGLLALAAADGEGKAVLIVNHSEKAKEVQLNVTGEFEAYLIDEKHFMEKADLDLTSFTIGENQVVLVKNHGA